MLVNERVLRPPRGLRCVDRMTGESGRDVVRMRAVTTRKNGDAEDGSSTGEEDEEAREEQGEERGRGRYVGADKEGQDRYGRFTMGEKLDQLALVIEKGEVEFETSTDSR